MIISLRYKIKFLNKSCTKTSVQPLLRKLNLNKLTLNIKAITKKVELLVSCNNLLRVIKYHLHRIWDFKVHRLRVVLTLRLTICRPLLLQTASSLQLTKHVTGQNHNHPHKVLKTKIIQCSIKYNNNQCHFVIKGTSLTLKSISSLKM